MLRNINMNKKNDLLVHNVELIHTNPNYAYIKLPDDRESTAALKDLASSPRPNNYEVSDAQGQVPTIDKQCKSNSTSSEEEAQLDQIASRSPTRAESSEPGDRRSPSPTPRRSSRPKRTPHRLHYPKLGQSDDRNSPRD